MLKYIFAVLDWYKVAIFLKWKGKNLFLRKVKYGGAVLE
jgi:hypothetical protein